MTPRRHGDVIEVDHPAVGPAAVGDRHHSRLLINCGHDSIGQTLSQRRIDAPNRSVLRVC
jgi:hypothetical protein